MKLNYRNNDLVIAETTTGTVKLNAETGMTPKFETTLRNFLLLSNRLYSENALNSNTEIILSQHNPSNPFDSSASNNYLNSLNSYEEFFVLKANMIPRDFNETITVEDEKQFIAEIIDFLGFSKERGVRGTRAVFTTDLEESNSTLQTYVFVSKAVFYNDFRVTIGFPQTDSEKETIISKTKDYLNSTSLNSKYMFLVEQVS